VEFCSLFVRDGSAPTAVDPDIGRAKLAQTVDEEAEELHVTALVRRNRDCVRVFLHRSGRDFLDRAVVSQMHDLGTLRLEDSPHDVDRSIMPVEE